MKNLLDNLRSIFDFYKSLGFESLPLAQYSFPPGEKERDTHTKKGQEEALALLREKIGDCTRCKLHEGRKNIVYGEGNPDARLMFIGEGPGADEDMQGRPFVGRAGMLLTSMIQKMGFQREDVYIANIVKCRPPHNRVPQGDEIEQCFPFLESQIDIISPDAIMTLGNIATRALLSMEKKITELRGHFQDYKGIQVMPTFHPSYLLRNTDQKWVTWNDALKVLKVLGIEGIHS